jgi:chromosome segregation ATPase
MEKDIVTLKTELQQAKDNHEKKRCEIKVKNGEKEKEIRQFIDRIENECNVKIGAVNKQLSNILTDNTKCEKEMRSIHAKINKLDAEKITFSENVKLELQSLSKTSKTTVYDVKTLRQSLGDTNRLIDVLKQPKDTLLSGLKNQMKTVRDRLKNVELDADDTNAKFKSQTETIANVKENVQSVVTRQRDFKKELKRLEGDIKYQSTKLEKNQKLCNHSCTSASTNTSNVSEAKTCQTAQCMDRGTNDQVADCTVTVNNTQVENVAIAGSSTIVGKSYSSAVLNSNNQKHGIKDTSAPKSKTAVCGSNEDNKHGFPNS